MNPKKDKIGAGWTKISQKGNRFISGQIEHNGDKIPFIMFKNSYKEEGSKQPDFIIYASDSDVRSDV